MIKTSTTKINFHYLLKLSIYYFLAFLLFYVEPIHVAGLKIAIIWKIIFLAIMIVPITIHIFKKRKIEPFVLFALLLSLKMFFNLSSFEYFNTTISIVVKNMMFPLMFIFFTIKLSQSKLLFLAKHFSIFTVISFVPFLLNLLQSLSKGYGLGSFGFENSFGLIGTFMGPHSASEALGIVLIVLYYFFQEERNKYMKLFYLALLLLGTYEIILTYARSGLVIAIIGIFYLWVKEKGKKKIVTFFLFVIPITLTSVYIYQTNKVFQMRLMDKTIYNQQKLGSGRLDIAEHAINNWYTEDISGNILGLGYNYGVEKMYQSLGNPIFAHNYYIQILQQEGLIGVMLFIFYLYFLGKYILKHKKNFYYKISMALFLGYLVEMLLQGNFLFHMFFLLAIFLALMKKTEERI